MAFKSLELGAPKRVARGSKKSGRGWSFAASLISPASRRATGKSTALLTLHKARRGRRVKGLEAACASSRGYLARATSRLATEALFVSSSRLAGYARVRLRALPLPSRRGVWRRERGGQAPRRAPGGSDEAGRLPSA